jgi:parvulin-like peptidyl-prolyl isomerase
MMIRYPEIQTTFIFMMVKNLKTILGILFVGVIFVVSQTSQVSAISVKELLGLEKSQDKIESVEEKKLETSKKEKTAENKNDGDWAKSSATDGILHRQIDLDYVSLLITNMNVQERSKVLEDPSLFKQVIENEANNRSTVSAAVSNKLVNDRNVEFLMRRGAENILREAYLNRLVVSKLPKDFPSNEQVSEYFESNKAQFVVPERVHVWQIFFKKSEGADADEIISLKQKAEKIISEIKKGKADYSNVAISQSEHEQSKALGGYMGLLKTSDLLPELKESLLKLKEGELSKPVESASGMHILKRGKIIEAETLQLSQVEQQIRQLLINQANNQLRNAIFVQARKEYPQDISDKKLEEWRLRLKTNTN